MTLRIVERTKTCNGCGQAKPWSDYYAKARWDDGTMRQPHSRCKTCAAEQCKRAYWADPESARQRSRNYRAENVEKSRATVRRNHGRRLANAETHAIDLDRRRQAYAKREGLKRPARGPRVASVGGRIFLPLEPLRAVFEEMYERLGSWELVYRDSWLGETTVKDVRFGRSESVELATVDTVAVALERPDLLAELYPGWYETGVAA